jgi:hypothetical protein
MQAMLYCLRVLCVLVLADVSAKHNQERSEINRSAADLFFSPSRVMFFRYRPLNGGGKETYTVPLAPAGIAFDGVNVWVASMVSNTVTKLRASDGQVLGSFPVSFAYGLAFDGANLLVTNSTNVTKLRASDGVNLGSVVVAPPTSGLNRIASTEAISGCPTPSTTWW